MSYLKINILIVEDNHQDFLIFKEIISQIDDFVVKMDHAPDMLEASELISKNVYDIIFLDLFLPDSFGQDTFKAIQKLDIEAPVVILSGLSDKNIALDIVKLGAQDYIVKGDFNSILLEKSIIYSIERKRFQEKLQKSEKKYRSTFKSVGVAIGDFDYTNLKKYLDELKSKGVKDILKNLDLITENIAQNLSLLEIKDLNPAALDLYACESIDEYRDNMLSFFADSSIDHVKTLILAIWNDEPSYRIEEPFKNLKGERVNSLKQAVLLGNDVGYYRLLMSTVDISLLKEKESEVKNQAALLQVISDSAAILLSESNLSEAINKTLSIIGDRLHGDRANLFNFVKTETGYDYTMAHEWLAEGISSEKEHDIMLKGKTEDEFTAFMHVLESGKCFEIQTKDLSGPSAEILNLLEIKSLLAAPVIYNNKLKGAVMLKSCKHVKHWNEYQTSSLLSYTGNIGATIERHQTQVMLKEMNETLEQRVRKRTEKMREALQELESFSYSVSHDLRAPLRAIGGFTQVLVEEYKSQMDEQAQHYLGIIEKGSKQMSQLIDDLLNFSRTGRKNLEVSTVNMAATVKDVVRELSALVEDRDITFSIQSLENCNGDKSLIRQVWVNFIWNSIKYSKNTEKAQIEIGCTDSGDFIEYYIKDNGIGFNMKYVEKLFGVFQRLHSDTEFEGTGVGLAIVQRIVHRHNGQIEAFGEVDNGACFKFKFPKVGVEIEEMDELIQKEILL